MVEAARWITYWMLATSGRPMIRRDRLRSTSNAPMLGGARYSQRDFMPTDDDDALAVEEDDLLGKVLDERYRIVRLLGSGGMGRVYLAHHQGIDRTVAIKVLHTEFGKNRAASQRFQREALASGRLDHANIVTVSDFGVLDDGRCFMVMEALEGESLQSRIKREGPIPWPAAFDIMRSVLRGLRHAHERGVVHRDIKPDNIFLATKDGESVVKLLDFGIAKLFAQTADDPTATRAGLTMGTPAYLSPEQAVGGTITPATDLYSATVVLFEMLTGHAPFEGETAMGMMISHISAAPPRLADVAPGIQLPAGVEELVQRGLTKMAADRIGSASEYVAELDGIRRVADPDFATRGPLARESAPIAIPRLDSGPLQQPRTIGQRASSLHTPQPDVAYGGTLDAISVSTAHTSAAPHRATSAAGVARPLRRRQRALLGGVIAIAMVLGIVFVRGGDKAPSHATRPAPSAVQPASPPTPAPVPVAIPEPESSRPDREVQLKALLHDLSTGKTCAARRVVISQLVALGDARAIPALKAARYRMRGGLLGVGQKNANACLKADAEAAMRALETKR